MMDFVAAFATENDASKLEFSIRNARKDVGYYSAMADELGAPSMMSPATKQALGVASNTGHGDNRVSEMVTFFRELFTSK